VAAACRGEEEGVRVLYRHLNPRLVRYLRHQLRYDAEDVAADVWVNLAPLLARFEGGLVELRALMFTIARRRVIDHQRRCGRLPLTTQLEECDDSVSICDLAEDAALDHLTGQQAVGWLARRLPPAQAEVVVLRVLGDLDVKTVATILGKSVGSVRVLQHRALRHLQQDFSRQPVTTLRG
jgi:RNA polymerase sigma-70 factor (ECF subfamily)